MSNRAISGYRIIKPIGSGGTSQVYLAIQKSVGRTVAVKVLSKQLSNDKNFSERFLKEANCGVLNHPNIITIYDAGKSNGQLYIAMEYLLGGDLKSRMQSSISENDVIKIISQISQALSHAHKNNFTHRDIKPGNILFDENNNAILADFGIAKTIHFSETSKAIEGFIGTPNYISPEQIENHKIDHRVDLYCLGIVYYEILTGKKLFTADSPYALLFKHLKESAPDLPKRLIRHQAIIHKLLDKDPDERYQSAEDLLNDLRTFQTEKPTQQTTISKLKTGLVLVSLLVSLSTTVFFQFKEPTPEPIKAHIIAPPIDNSIIEKLKADIIKSTEKTAASEKKQAELEKASLHLTEASRFLSINQYISADENNALYEFKQALIIQPNNTQAQYGIKTIINHYTLLANNEKAKNNFTQSLEYISTALMINNNDQVLLQLHKDISLLQDNKTSRTKIANGLKKADKLIGKNKYKKAKQILLSIQKLDKKNNKISNRLKHTNKEIRKKNQIDALTNKSIQLLNETPVMEVNVNLACENIYSLLHLLPENKSLQTIKDSCANQYFKLAKQANSNEDALEYIDTGLNYNMTDQDLIKYRLELIP